MINEPVFVTLLVIDELEHLSVPYLIGGSFASTAYGRIRTTQDVDIVANLEQDQVNDFIASLGVSFYADEAMIRNAITRRTSFNLIHLDTMFKVDIFLPKNRPFDQQQLARRTRRIIDKASSREVYFATPEDTILAKLEWYRLGGQTSERQWRDIQGIFQQRADLLDMDYLKESAQVLLVADLLEGVLTES